MRGRRALKFNRRIADEQDKIFFFRDRVIFQRLELREQVFFREQNFQQIYAGERSRVAEDFHRLGQWFLVRENDAVNFAQRTDSDAIKNYSVTFPMAAKITVKGEDMAPIYKWLTEKKHNGFKDSEVKWNFQKYLINEKGQLIDVIEPRTKANLPEIIKEIENS